MSPAITRGLWWSVVLGTAMVLATSVLAPDMTDAALWWYAAGFVGGYMVERKWL